MQGQEKEKEKGKKEAAEREEKSRKVRGTEEFPRFKYPSTPV